LRVIGEIEGGVEIVDPATGVATSSVIRVVLARADQRPEDKNNVIIPRDRDPFRAGRSLAPEQRLRAQEQR
jgi:hypothetical protein